MSYLSGIKGASERVRSAFGSVERHVFVPDRIYVRADHRWLAVDHADDPAAWRQHVDTDTAITTQVDDDPDARTGRLSSSSTSEPSIMAAMLDVCDLRPGHKVLEIGTGTGWNAALLAHIAGAANVTTIEVDPAVARQAKASLTRAGCGEVNVVVADGAQEYTAGGLYDCVLSTCAVSRIPYPWVEQSHPGGRIVTPYGNAYHNGALLKLTVRDNGEATGTFTDHTPVFMQMRAQRCLFGSVKHWDAPHHLWQHTVTDIYPYDLVAAHDSAFAISLAMPDVNVHVVPHDDPNDFDVWFIHQATRSVAHLTVRGQTGEYRLRQRGERHLYEEAARALTWWDTHGKPPRSQLGVTVTPHTHTAWAWNPHNPIPTASSTN